MQNGYNYAEYDDINERAVSMRMYSVPGGYRKGTGEQKNR